VRFAKVRFPGWIILSPFVPGSCSLPNNLEVFFDCHRLKWVTNLRFNWKERIPSGFLGLRLWQTKTNKSQATVVTAAPQWSDPLHGLAPPEPDNRLQVLSVLGSVPFGLYPSVWKAWFS
jgi:hypothetical protein